MLPRARRDRLTVRELAEETLVYDAERDKAHCLNRASALVWRHCDGKTTVAGLACILHQSLGVPQAEAAAHLALEQLSRRGLLQQPLPPLSAAERLSRRDALRKLVVAAVALPLALTITAPQARAAASLTCTNDSQCDGGICCNGSCCRPGQFCAGTEGCL
jgi:hypothetical protein